MMYSRHGRILGLALGLIFLAGCKPSCDPSVLADFPIDPNVDMSLLNGLPCVPPCWQGLIPGSSNKADVYQALNNAPFVEDGSLLEQQSADGGTVIYWNSAFSSIQNAVVLDADNRISRIVISQVEYEVSIGDVIEVLGIPDGEIVTLSAPETSLCYTGRVIWTASGVYVSTPGQPTEEEIDVSNIISNESQIQSVVYFTPAASLEEYERREGLIGQYQEWNAP